MLSNRSILLTGGSVADDPHAAGLTLSIAKAGLQTAAKALFEPLKDQNINIAVQNVGAAVAPGSDVSHEIADAIWTVCAAPKDQ